MATWLVLSSSCGKNGIGRQERSNNWMRRSPRSPGSLGNELELGARFRPQDGQESRLLRERDGQRRGETEQKQNVVTMPKKKTMSAASRRKIAAAQRARWAKVKAAQKKSA